MQRPQRTRVADCFIGLLCLVPSPAFIDRYKRIEFRIPSFDLCEVRLEQFGWRETSSPDTRDHLPRGKLS